MEKNKEEKDGIAFKGKSTFLKVKIECPNCGNICDAEVECNADFPFNCYCHECEHCGHMITESEWEEVENG